MPGKSRPMEVSDKEIQGLLDFSHFLTHRQNHFSQVLIIPNISFQKDPRIKKRERTKNVSHPKAYHSPYQQIRGKLPKSENKRCFCWYSTAQVKVNHPDFSVFH